MRSKVVVQRRGLILFSQRSPFPSVRMKKTLVKGINQIAKSDKFQTNQTRIQIQMPYGKPYKNHIFITQPYLMKSSPKTEKTLVQGKLA